MASRPRGDLRQRTAFQPDQWREAPQIRTIPVGESIGCLFDAIEAASDADVLLVVGTSGATNLPMQVGNIAAGKGAVIVDINPDFNPFSAIATKNGGFFLQGPSGKILPELVELFS